MSGGEDQREGTRLSGPADRQEQLTIERGPGCRLSSGRHPGNRNFYVRAPVIDPVNLGKREGRGGTRLVLAAIAVACALVVVARAAAEDGTEATTFGADGIASQSLGVHFERTQFSSLVARPDGGLVAQRDDQVETYLPNGSPDPAAPPRQLPQYGRIFPLASGKSLLLDGWAKLTRLNSDGSVDTSFGGGTIKVAGEVSAAAELPSGKTLLAGTGSGGTKTRISWVTVQLVNPDGSIDRGLGYEGRQTLSLPPYIEALGTLEIAPTEDGGALVSGPGFLLRLRADGSPDPGFGGDGLVDGLPRLVGGRVLADGSIMAVGSGVRPNEKDSDLLVLRYTAAGAPVPGFGQDGIRWFDFGGAEGAWVASWAADGSVVVGGATRSPGPCFEAAICEEMPLLAAFGPGGDLEPSFGDGGVLRLASLAESSERLEGSGANVLARRPDGSLVAGGSSAPKATTAFLAAVSPQGALLPGFGEGGIVRMRRPLPATQRLTGFAPLADGGLLAAGNSDVGVEDSAVLIRYSADGGLDRSFGGGAGYVTVGEGRFVTGFAYDGSGRVLMGIYGYPRSKLLVLRAADGAREPSFGSDGEIFLPKRVWTRAAGFTPDGGAIVAGTRNVAGDPEPGVVLRYRPNGEFARGYGRDGRLELRTPAGREVRARALVTGAGGRALVGGIARRRFALVRLLPDGRPDPRFGSKGWVLSNAGGSPRSVALRRQGSRIYLAGTVVQYGEQHRLVLLRLKANGRPDRSFGRNGRDAVSIPEPAEPKAIFPSRNGVLVVLSRGPKPLLFFGRGGRVRRQPVGPDQRFVTNVRATAFRGQLVLGWNAFSRAIKRDVYHLAKRPRDRHDRVKPEPASRFGPPQKGKAG